MEERFVVIYVFYTLDITPFQSGILSGIQVSFLVPFELPLSFLFLCWIVLLTLLLFCSHLKETKLRSVSWLMYKMRIHYWLKMKVKRTNKLQITCHSLEKSLTNNSSLTRKKVEGIVLPSSKLILVSCSPL